MTLLFNLPPVQGDCLVAAIRYNYDNTEGMSREAVIAYWAALTEAAKEDEPRHTFDAIHAALPFTPSTAFHFDLTGYEVFKHTEALTLLISRVVEQAIASRIKSVTANQKPEVMPRCTAA